MVARNPLVIVDVAFTRAQEKLENWKANGATDFAMFRLEKAKICRLL